MLTYLRGHQIWEEWHQHFDPYQGTFEVLWTPEKDRDAAQTNEEYLFYISGGYYLRYEHDTQQLVFRIGSQSNNVAYTTVAGTTVALVARFDCNNDLDGAGNYTCVSLDNVHTYGTAVQPTVAGPGANMHFGERSSTLPLNGIMEGGHFHRRVWTSDDGNGINVGNTPGSDEIT